MTTQKIGTDINLVNLITDLLAQHNHKNPQAWITHLNQDALATTDQGIQRFLINRAWRTILGAVTDRNTMDIRYCLVDNGEYHDWLRLFEQGVLPCILELNLPNQ